MGMTGALDQNFSAFYFDWFRAQADPRSGGFVCPPKVHASKTPQLDWMTCFVQVLWQFQFANETWAYPEVMVNATLDMQNSSTGWFCVSPGGSDPGKDCRTSS